MFGCGAQHGLRHCAARFVYRLSVTSAEGTWIWRQDRVIDLYSNIAVLLTMGW
jgi:hypothetical protein